MRKLITIPLILLFLTLFTFTQEKETEETKTYKHVKVKLLNGEELKGKKLVLNDSEIIFTPVSWTGLKTIALNEIEYIKAAKKNQSLLLAGIGGTVTAGIMFLLVKNRETTIEGYYGSATYDDYRRPTYSYTPINPQTTGASITTKIAVVAGGIVIGGLIGLYIKTGWNKVFTFDKAELSLGVSLSKSSFLSPVFCMNFKF